MSQRSVFYQTCPVCGRSLRMPVEAFGRRVNCVHCGGEFRSTDGQNAAPIRDDQAVPLSHPSLPHPPLPDLPLSFVVDCLPAMRRHP